MMIQNHHRPVEIQPESVKLLFLNLLFLQVSQIQDPALDNLF